MRPYNGKLYNQGTVESKSLAKCFEGDTVRFDLDSTAHTLSIAINGKEYGVCFTGLPAAKLYPCVAFYGSNREVELVSCSSSIVVTTKDVLAVAPAAGIPDISCPSAVFDSMSPEGIALTGEGKLVKTLTSSKVHALVNQGYTKGKAWWEFKVRNTNIVIPVAIKRRAVTIILHFPLVFAVNT